MFKVASFIGEKDAVRKYDSKIRIACTATITQWLAMGIGLGILPLIIFGSYGLAVWYGGKLIIPKNYNSGKVIMSLWP